ncbi:MAG TPA: class I SAM-dependent methyltransferase [Gammaproteobacteria bacterium]|nr:class I SAM-dependent methyltransferase [Gammaproteobacteria bacterium]
MKSDQAHWDAIFAATKEEKLGWYEPTVKPMLGLLSKIPKWRQSTFFLTGAGTSLLIDALYTGGASLVVNDISARALQRLRSRMQGSTQSVSGQCIDYLCQDISRPVAETLPAVQIWVDRAVLHFLNEPAQIQGYVDNLKSILNQGGYAAFAEFAAHGASKCAALPVHRYSVEALSEQLGTEFTLITHFDHMYINPDGGKRPYIYALYQRVTA